MKRLLTLLLLGLGGLLCATPLWADISQAETMAVGQIDPAQSKAHLQVERLNATRTAVRLNAPEIQTAEHWVDYRRLQSFTIVGEALLPAEERPALPQVSRLYQIPNQGSVHVELGTLEYDVVENVDALPLMLEVQSFQQVTRDAQVYTKDAWYPEQIAVLSEPAIFRELRVVQLVLYPVQVNPVTHQARIYRNLEAQIVATNEPGENELLDPGPLTGSYVPMYRQMVANLDETLLATATTTPGTYYIICTQHPDMQASLASLVEWKTRKGFRVIVDARSDWTTTTMASAILSAYNAYDPKLEYVCLMGDPQPSTPPDPFGVPTDGSTYDHGFALVAGNDEIEDIGIGRLSGTDGGQMAVINAKIMGYERDPFMGDTTWYHKGFFYAGVANTIASNWTLMQWASQQFRSWTGVTNNTVLNVDGAVNPATVVSQFNSGISFFFWRGSWLSQMDNTLAGTTSPGWRLPICLCVTCGANEFVYGLGTAESYLVAGSVNNPQGGVASVGTTTSGTHAPQNITFAGGLIFAIANQAIEHIGHAMNAGKTWLVMTYGMTNSNTQSFSRWNNLMGDPGLSMWTDVPEVMNVVHPAALDVGARRVAVSVTRAADNAPVADALVVLWKHWPDSTWERGLTDSQGQIVLPVNVRAPGEMYLTITKHNHKPYLATLPCSTATGPAPMLCTYTIDDNNIGGTSGNANGALNPGEVIDLPLWVRNFSGTAAAINVSATLATNNPHVTVMPGAAGYGNLVAGDSAVSSPPFRIHVSPQMQHRETVLLTLTVTSASGITQSAFALTCTAGNLISTAQQLNGPLDPGASRDLSVTLLNTGPFALSGVTAQLRSSSPFIQVLDPSGTFGNMGSGAQATNSGDVFTVRPHPSVYGGQRTLMTLITSTVDGQVDTVNFVLTVSTTGTTDPTGPDDYGYYAYDNTDVGYEFHPTYNYVAISTGLGTNLNLNDMGEKNDIGTLTSTVRRLPFSFKFYGQVYDSITICSNGWCAFGNQAWNDNFRNYHIPAMQAPQAMIAPFWNDLCTSGITGGGVWSYYDAANHRYILQWKAVNLNSSGSCDGSTANLDFEVILFDPVFYPTADGNGKVLVQYQAVTLPVGSLYGEPEGFASGIQDQRGLVGIGYYNFYDGYAPGTAALATGRAILYTTEARTLYGELQGTVRDVATDAPLPGVLVSLDGTDYQATTDDDGTYHMTDVFIGQYTARGELRHYNDGIANGVIIGLDSLTTINFTLEHPDMTLSIPSIDDTTSVGAPRDTSFTVFNPGSGPLDYHIQIRYAGEEISNPWDSVSTISVTSLTSDYQIQGCEFAGDCWWVTGGSGSGGQNVIYKFNPQGYPVGYIPQPSTTSIGWFDMAWDGHLLWGSDGPYLIGIDTLGNVVDSIPSPMNPSRAIAYDPELHHFWVTDNTQNLYEVDTVGNYTERYLNEGPGELTIKGLAWNSADTSGYKLYIFSQNGGQATRVSRLNPDTGHMQFVVVLGQTGDQAGGCTITGGFNSTFLVFAGIVGNPSGDRLTMWELDYNTTWVTVAPAAGIVSDSSLQQIAVRINPESLLHNGVYRVDLRITSESFDSTLVLPVSLDVERPVADLPSPHSLLPQKFALYQNYPNPFNPSTRIRFDLPQASLVKLEIYNSLGQLVTTLADEVQNAGSHSITWNGQSQAGINVSSGLYFVRLQAGDFVSTRKMLLMK